MCHLLTVSQLLYTVLGHETRAATLKEFILREQDLHRILNVGTDKQTCREHRGNKGDGWTGAGWTGAG